MTNEHIMRTALLQSAVDLCCETEDFLSSESKVVVSKSSPGARKYLKLPFVLELASYGSNIVASCSPELVGTAKSYINRPDFYHCFETPALHELGSALSGFGARVQYMAEYFLPDVEKLSIALERNRCPFETRLLTKQDFSGLYLPEWSNALCKARSELDTLGIAAFDRDKMVGFAACSADCDSMWQIGIDVLPEYRRRGIAKALVTSLAAEIISRGKVPFYCAAWSNLRSVSCALASGFRPAWVEVTAIATSST